jgi:hypothetical protein
MTTFASAIDGSWVTENMFMDYKGWDVEYTSFEKKKGRKNEIHCKNVKPLTWKLFNELFFWALASLLFTHVTISFSTMGLPVLASCVKIESV